MEHEDAQSAALVVRVWHEPGTPPQDLRARFTETAEVEGHAITRAVRGEDEIVDAFRSWLRGFTQR
jgi:hypothetical protein